MTATEPEAGDFLSRLLSQVDRAQEFYAPTLDPSNAIATRLEITDFLSGRLAEIEDAAEATAAITAPESAAGGSPGGETLPIFSYWDSSPEPAPPLVQACLRQLLRVHPGAHILNRKTVDDYIDIPPIVAARLEARPAHFTDYVRTALLERYGGAWVDATCFVPRELTGEVLPLIGNGTFYLRWGGTQISNWFIASRPHDPIIGFQRAALETWWTENEHLPDYFLYHRIFESLHFLMPELRRRWRNVPRVSTIPSHLLQVAMFRAYDPVEVDAMLASTFIQKLSYKYDADTVPAGSILAVLLADGLTGD